MTSAAVAVIMFDDTVNLTQVSSADAERSKLDQVAACPMCHAEERPHQLSFFMRR